MGSERVGVRERKRERGSKREGERERKRERGGVREKNCCCQTYFSVVYESWGSKCATPVEET